MGKDESTASGGFSPVKSLDARVSLVCPPVLRLIDIDGSAGVAREGFILHHVLERHAAPQAERMASGAVHAGG